MINIITIKQGDTFPPLRGYLQMRTGVAINLTDASVRLILRDSEDNIVLNKTVIIDSFKEGAVSYKWFPEDTAVVGEFRGEFKITWLDGTIVSVPNDEYFILNIVKQLGGGA